MSDKARVAEYLADFAHQDDPHALIGILANVLRHYLQDLSIEAHHLEALSAAGKLDPETLQLTLHKCLDTQGKMYDMLTAAVLYVREHKKQTA